MGPSASAEDFAPRLDAVRFPPRERLPHGIAVEPLPGLGTTWYERGPAYWARRTGLVILAAAFLTVLTFLMGSFLRAAGPTGSPRFIGMLAAEIVISLASGTWVTYRSWRHPGAPSARAYARARVIGVIMAGLGAAGFVGGPVGAVAGAGFAVFIVFTYGIVLAAFITILVAPRLPRERLARRRLARQLEHHQFLHRDRSTRKRKRRRR